MTVTRVRRYTSGEQSPGDQPPPDPRAEARLIRDRVRVVGFFAGRAQAWQTIRQVLAGTRLPIERAYTALDDLVAAGHLRKHNEHRLPGGMIAPAWCRLEGEESS